MYSDLLQFECYLKPMRYQSFLPLSALIALGLMLILIHFGVVPPGITLLEELKSAFDDYFA